jgi:hypothetical protein
VPGNERVEEVGRLNIPIHLVAGPIQQGARNRKSSHLDGGMRYIVTEQNYLPGVLTTLKHSDGFAQKYPRPARRIINFDHVPI